MPAVVILFRSAHGNMLNVCLWITQLLLFAAFCAGGAMKLMMPVARISKMFAWTGQVPKPFLRFIGVVDLAGGLGLLLPTLTHIHPRLAVIAAFGCIILQILAIGFTPAAAKCEKHPSISFCWLSAHLCCGADRRVSPDSQTTTGSDALNIKQAN